MPVRSGSAGIIIIITVYTIRGRITRVYIITGYTVIIACIIRGRMYTTRARTGRHTRAGIKPFAGKAVREAE